MLPALPGILRAVSFFGARTIGASAGERAFRSVMHAAGRPMRYSTLWAKLSMGLDKADDIMQTVDGAVWLGSKLFGGAMQTTTDNGVVNELAENLLLYRDSSGAHSNKIQSTLALQAMADDDAEWPLMVYSALYPGKLSGTDQECAALAASLILFYNDEATYMAYSKGKKMRDAKTFLQQPWKERTWGGFLWDWTGGWITNTIGATNARTKVQDVVDMDIIGVKELIEFGSFILFLRNRWSSQIDEWNKTQTDDEKRISAFDAVGIIRFVQNYCRTNWASDRQTVAAIPPNVTPEEVQTYWASQVNKVIATILNVSMSGEYDVKKITDYTEVIRKVTDALKTSDRIYSPKARDIVYDYLVAAAERVKRDLY